MSIKFIKDWDKRQLRCHFCGETRSVKYETEVFDPVLDTKPTMVCMCNKCALLYKESDIAKGIDIDEVEKSITEVINLIQTIKTIYLDAPDSTIVECSNAIRLLEEFRSFWKKTDTAKILKFLDDDKHV